MAAPIFPDDPNKTSALSDREETALAGIEDALATADPVFAARMTRRESVPTSRAWRLFDLSSLLVFAVLIVVVMAGRLPLPWWPLLGALTLLLLVWVLMCARAGGPQRQRGSPPSDTPNRH
jgi:peptidoglycan/LPS O-acetylase OafA/YrhL